MSRVPPVRSDLNLSEGYHSPQVEAEVRLNTNESPFAPPDAWREELLDALGDMSFHRYPDRHATELRQAVAGLHGVGPDEVFCANGSNEVLQSLLLAFGGPGRRAVLFEPTYALHSHISRITGTEVVAGARDDDFRIDRDDARRLLAAERPHITFLCSPNNPTGRAEPPETVEAVLECAPGLVIVDEAYGQFSAWSALELLTGVAGPNRWPSGGPGRPRGHAHVLEDVGPGGRPPGIRRRPPRRRARLRGGRAALPPLGPDAGRRRARAAAHARDGAPGRVDRRGARSPGRRPGRPARRLVALGRQFPPVPTREREADDVWHDLVERSVLIRNCADWDGLRGCLRVTVGTPEENDRFLLALKESL